MSSPLPQSTELERRISWAIFREVARLSGTAINWEITSPQTLYRVADPYCTKLKQDNSSLASFCSNGAVATDPDGKNIILQTAAPGTLGTLGLNPIYGPGSWNFDGNLQKKIRIGESRSLAVRLDARNILNHPTPGNPNLNMNSGIFGQITTKTGSRTLAGQVRLEF